MAGTGTVRNSNEVAQLPSSMATLKLVVTGGAGQIAYSLIPLIARGLVFGPGVRVHLRLLDIPPAANALDGERAPACLICWRIYRVVAVFWAR